MHLQRAEADDDRDGDAVDRDQLEADALDLAIGLLGDGHRRRNGAEQHVDPILAVGQPLRRAGVDPDRLRLVGRQRDPARRVDDHVAGRFLRGGGLLHFFQRAVGQHPAELDRDAVGRRLFADIVEDHLGALAAVEDEAGRRDQQVADGGLGAAREERERRCRQRRGGEMDLQILHFGDPQLFSVMERSPRLASGMVDFRSTIFLQPQRKRGRRCRQPLSVAAVSGRELGRNAYW